MYTEAGITLTDESMVKLMLDSEKKWNAIGHSITARKNLSGGI